MEPTRPVALVVKVVQARVDVVVGFMSPTTDGHLTMGGLLGKGLPMFHKHVYPIETCTNAFQARGYVRKSGG